MYNNTVTTTVAEKKRVGACNTGGINNYILL